MIEDLTIEDLLKRLKQDPAAAKVLVAEIVKAMTKEYLTIGELAERLSLDRKSVKNKMASGIFQKGIHYFSPPGIGPRFKWSAIQELLEGKESHDAGGIAMRKGYTLNPSTSGLWTNGTRKRSA